MVLSRQQLDDLLGKCAECPKLRAEVKRLHAQRDRYREVLRLRHTCVVCGAELIPNDAAPHCEGTCHPNEEQQAYYEAAIRDEE